MSVAGRRARRLLRRTTSRHKAGTEPVRIDDLVSPLRYDVLVRERFLARLRQARGDDLATALASPAGTAYLTWFREIVIRRFKPELIGREQAIEEAFAARVQASRDLIESVEAEGYDPGRPIILLSGRRIAATATGKQIGRRLFAGDGCHRLALLRLRGVTVLDPGTYRVEIAPRLEPLDNTTILIPPLGLTRSEYFRFLALTYAPRSGCDSEAELRRHVAAHDPDRLAELDGVLAVDRPLLDLAAGR